MTNTDSVVVPREPTEAMCRAGLSKRHDDLAKSIWKAMIAAAPVVSAGEGGLTNPDEPVLPRVGESPDLVAAAKRVCEVMAGYPFYSTALNDLREALRQRPPSAGLTNGDVFDFEAHLVHQAAWSEQTFGPGKRTAGVCDHIRKELAEVEADPEDTQEWIDVVILALDGAWRSGMTPQEIIAGIVAKQRKNEGRVWPDWRTADPGKAIEHDRSHDAAQPEQDAGAEIRKLRHALNLVYNNSCRADWPEDIYAAMQAALEKSP